MTRLLILGAAPLPFESLARQYAANLRTWHLTRPLLTAGHQVRLIACRLPNTYGDQNQRDPVIRSLEGGMEYFSLTEEVFESVESLQEMTDEFCPDALIGINTYPASRAARITTDKPMWCDLNGWVMAEGQSKAFVYDDNRYLSHFWKMERSVLERADAISTVSRPQRFAVIGELAALGRLNKETTGYPFVHWIPNALSETEYRHDHEVFRGRVVPRDAFVVLWVGGYNTWTDVDTLFHGLERAMSEFEDLHFVSTGGAIEGHDDLTFQRFRDRIEASAWRERFHLMGWVPTEQVPSFYFESDLGINIDGQNYETVFGARNRLNDMLKCGLPILTTRGTEISEILAEHRLCLECAIGDSQALGAQLAVAASNRQELREMGDRARQYAEENFSYRRTTEPLLNWARQPERAPDRGRRVEFEDIDFFVESAPDATPLVEKRAGFLGRLIRGRKTRRKSS